MTGPRQHVEECQAGTKVRSNRRDTRAAGIARIDLSTPTHIGGKLVTEISGARYPAHCHDIAGVILMAVGQRAWVMPRSRRKESLSVGFR
jgi:hypothetical protein